MELLFMALTVIVGVGIAAGLGFSWPSGNLKSIPAIAFGVVVILVGLVIVPQSMGTVGAGERGVVLRLGAVTDRTLDEGLYFKTPFMETVKIMTVQTLAFVDDAAAASKDLQTVSTQVTLNYSLDPTKVNFVYQNFRYDYEVRIVDPAVQEAVKAGTAQYTAAQLITERPTVKTNIEDRIRERLEEKGMVVDTLQLTDFQFSDSFNTSVESKVKAEQLAQEAENKLTQIEVEARQAKQKAEGERDAAIARAQGAKQSSILKAQGEAEAVVLTATAQAEATVLAANAQAEANHVLDESLTEKVITYTTVQKLSPGIKTVVLPPGQPFIFGEGFLSK
jgi:prohibitin 2